jgi:hypothetical protein
VFQEGQVILFTPFYFKNGDKSKDKFFIVLKNIDDKVIIASLPTSVNKIPSFIKESHGCINHDDRCFNCYLFEAARPVCSNGFAFKLHTHIYGNEVEDYELSILNSVYGIEGIDFVLIGTLLEEEYKNLLACLKNSNSVKRKIKKYI